MTETYTVTLDGDEVGKVTLEVQGLYYQFHCMCRLPGKERISLYADREDLGILVPDKGYFCLTTKVPRKRFSGNNFTFRLVRKAADDDSILIPISADTAFPSVDRLLDANFVATPDGPAIRLPVK